MIDKETVRKALGVMEMSEDNIIRFTDTLNKLHYGEPQVSDRPGYDALWTSFGLSRAGWITIPRLLLHAMPDRWQGQLAKLLKEYEEFFVNQPDIKAYVSLRDGKTNRFIKGSVFHNYRHPDKQLIESMKTEGAHVKY